MLAVHPPFGHRSYKVKGFTLNSRENWKQLDSVWYTMKSNDASNPNSNNSHVEAILLNRLTERHAQRQGTSFSSPYNSTTLTDFLEVAIQLSSATLAPEAQCANISDAVSNSKVESSSSDSSRPDESNA